VADQGLCKRDGRLGCLEPSPLQGSGGEPPSLGWNKTLQKMEAWGLSPEVVNSFAYLIANVASSFAHIFNFHDRAKGTMPADVCVTELALMVNVAVWLGINCGSNECNSGLSLGL